MKRIRRTNETQLDINIAVEGESIEEKMRKLMTEKETPAVLFEKIYTDKKDGVNPAFNIRTDRFEQARIASEKIEKSLAIKRAKSKSALNSDSEKAEQNAVMENRE